MAQKQYILLINKEQKILIKIAEILSRYGYDTHTTQTKTQAVSLLSSQNISLIISDYNLADATGIELLSELKKDARFRSIPFIFFIHLGSQHLLHPIKALELGAEDLIYYPVKTNVLLARIADFLPPVTESSPKKVDSLPKKERRQSKRKLVTPTLDAAISKKGVFWSMAIIKNFSIQGALVESDIECQPGDILSIKSWLPGGKVIAVGKLIHIVRGKNDKTDMLGIEMQEDDNWATLLSHYESLQSTETQTEVTSSGGESEVLLEDSDFDPDLDFSHFNLEVSKDQSLWMACRILKMNRKQVSVETSILSKINDKLHIRCTFDQDQVIVEGAVTQVVLNDFKMPAGLEIDLKGNVAYEKLYDRMLEIQVSTQGCSDNGDVSDDKPRPDDSESRMASIQNLAQSSENKDAWTDTILFSPVQRKQDDIKIRFYQSLVGRQLDNYEIVSFISSGGMGGVFKGWDVALERDVALKVISYELSSQEEFVDMFFKEARFISKLNHQNIAQIYYIGNTNDILFYVMEYIDGITLADIIRTGIHIEVEKMTQYMLTVCQTLDFVWQQNIIHRDIKPANIMVSKELIKIVDFGVAKNFKREDMAKSQGIVGSPRYLSPETIKGESVDYRSDIYSLGATFYHLFTGVPPFDDNSIQGILQKHLEEKPVSINEINPKLPKALNRIILKMLNKNPKKRFQSYQDIIKEIRGTVSKRGFFGRGVKLE